MTIFPQPPMPAVWRSETKPHKFCPGCGHPLVLKALGETIEELGIQKQTVFGCDIGCSLLAWDFFNLDTVQAHHGRVTPVIVGLQRANPQLVGIAYMGDGGGYAIGSQHLINAATRNEKMMVIVVNNTLYAMTGGQMAPTTLPKQKTETSPYGRQPETTGNPTLGPEMIKAVVPDSAYVARGTVARLPQLKKFLKKGLENVIAGRGFAFVEALAMCPTNWRTNAEETWKFLEQEMHRYFPVGELAPKKGEEQSGANH